mmetsp:Transcript_22842/g.63530  ORF Transcript_22842/g.63530 Transcript_22842/m.63530 type:complete len:221 (+) Transcript_22842:1357-2019(+)
MGQRRILKGQRMRCSIRLLVNGLQSHQATLTALHHAQPGNQESKYRQSQQRVRQIAHGLFLENGGRNQDEAQEPQERRVGVFEHFQRRGPGRLSFNDHAIVEYQLMITTVIVTTTILRSSLLLVLTIQGFGQFLQFAGQRYDNDGGRASSWFSIIAATHNGVLNVLVVAAAVTAAAAAAPKAWRRPTAAVLFCEIEYLVVVVLFPQQWGRFINNSRFTVG